MQYWFQIAYTWHLVVTCTLPIKLSVPMVCRDISLFTRLTCLKGGGREKFVFAFIAPRCCYSGVEHIIKIFRVLFRQLASKQRLEVELPI